MTPNPADAGSTRRQLLRTGAIGAAAAAFLAACGTDNKSPDGQSGVSPTTTLVPPTVPKKGPSEADLTQDTTVLRTATSLELLVAEQYTAFGPKLTDATWKAEAARFAEDHTAAADVFAQATEPEHRITEPNAFLQENSIDPIEKTLTTDQSILTLFHELESSIAATYIAAVGTDSDSDRRGVFAAYAAAAARRSALLGSGGTGSAPTAPLYPPTDLIPNAAYVPVDAPEADPGN